MPFKIAPYAGQTYARQYADHRDVRAYLGWGKLVALRLRYNGELYTTVKCDTLPLDFSGSVIVPLTDGRTTTVVCRPGKASLSGRRGKSSTHRTFATCPDCGASVPTGRTHQHKCK